MCKIDFYLLPSTDYKNITADDAVLLGKNIEIINEKDRFYVPNAFYDVEDSQGMTAVDYLYGEQNDVSMYLLETIRVQLCSEEKYNDLKDRENIGYAAFAHDRIDEEKEEICVYCSLRDIIKVKRFYALLADTYEEYIGYFEGAFPDLVFHKNAVDRIEKLGEFGKVKDELHRHLMVLCDKAKEIYRRMEKREEGALRALQAECHIYCSGKGANEKSDFKVKYGGVSLTCNPHTKLFSQYSDQRIYFCWGRDEIENHNIVIARIGDHWNKG